ncbi:hypothetical protein [Demequina litorisediminis]|uniref:Uncharacterized protein n=1 Tax=Demequina litorisediminis TaxID=1849022 RepID=A0ABQ6ICP1_9MICO|nr:hypothetical protein [Demequina litorisediminis]GMA35130.1 hypothetical protein GCM10025876_13340 [Demequina litorisediminis]
MARRLVVGDVSALNLIVLTAAEGSPATLIGTLVNDTAEDIAVEVSIDGETSTSLTLEADSTLAWAPRTVTPRSRAPRPPRPAPSLSSASPPTSPRLIRWTSPFSTARCPSTRTRWPLSASRTAFVAPAPLPFWDAGPMRVWARVSERRASRSVWPPAGTCVTAETRGNAHAAQEHTSVTTVGQTEGVLAGWPGREPGPCGPPT